MNAEPIPAAQAIRLECARLAEGRLDEARKLLEFVYEREPLGDSAQLRAAAENHSPTSSV